MVNNANKLKSKIAIPAKMGGKKYQKRQLKRIELLIST